MIILVEFLGQVVCIVSYDCRGMSLSALRNPGRELVQYLDDSDLLGRQDAICCDIVRPVTVDSFGIGLPED